MESNYNPGILTTLVFLLSVVLCCWTHPRYYESRIARLFRVPLGITSATWWLCYPFVFMVRPLETNFRTNLFSFCICYVLFTKSLDWSLFSGPQSRRKFVKTNSSPIRGSWQEVSGKEGTTSTFDALLGHVIFQFTSMRGLQYSWGHFSEINRNSLKGDFFRFVVFLAYSLVAIGSYANRKDFDWSSISEESNKFRLNVVTLSYMLYHWKNTMTIMTGLCTASEAFGSLVAIFAHLLHPQLLHFGFPGQICEYFDPVYYPPFFSNPLRTDSLTDFWGKTWHQGLRRSFIVFGAFPLGGLAAVLGFSPKHQRTMGFVGAFIASALIHACPFYFMSDPSTSSGRVPHGEILAVFLCFFSQALGCLIEHHVIRFIPKWLGGGKLWTMGFLSLTLSFFSHLAAKPGRFTNLFSPKDGV